MVVLNFAGDWSSVGGDVLRGERGEVAGVA